MFPEYSFFHTREWAQVLESTYQFRPVYFEFSGKNDPIGFIPFMNIRSPLTGKRLVSLPFSDYCEPLISSPEYAYEIKNEIFRYCKLNKLHYVEFRTSKIIFPIDASNYRTDLRHVLMLDKSEKEILKSFSENTKRNIKKSTKENVSVSVKNNSDGMKVFYDMFCVTRQKHGLPPQPLKFFKNIFDLIILKDLGDLIIAEHNNKPIAGAIYFKFGEKIIYKFGASYPQYFDFRGNNAVMWYAIQKYLNEKYKEFDFGRTEMNHEGLRKFKLSWNTQEQFIYTTRYNLKTDKYIPAEIKTEGFHNKVFNITPIWLLKFIGNTLYKHIG